MSISFEMAEEPMREYRDAMYQLFRRDVLMFEQVDPWFAEERRARRQWGRLRRSLPGYSIDYVWPQRWREAKRRARNVVWAARGWYVDWEGYE